MIITLKEDDIKDAIKSHLRTQGIDLMDLNTSIKLVKKQRAGIQAVVNLNAGDEADKPAEKKAPTDTKEEEEEEKQKDSSDGEDKGSIFG